MLQEMATITSKRQLTIPVKIFRKLGLQEGEKVKVVEENGAIKIISYLKLLDKLAGSVKVPRRFKGLTTDQMIEKARKEHFSKKYGFR
ncbi:AbrB/MazE/SpoVT family DNA-binding domain-containing protein [Candidatus Gottesmanbacteria bacterium]|nr:AbrB/MazE/SpoVT family DNA-binding domain-containing protein [Candidatus Gottesmanbacteria bacterium]